MLPIICKYDVHAIAIGADVGNLGGLPTPGFVWICITSMGVGTVFGYLTCALRVTLREYKLEVQSKSGGFCPIDFTA